MLLLVREKFPRTRVSHSLQIQLRYTRDKTITLNPNVCPRMQNTYLNKTLFKFKLLHVYILQTGVKDYYN